MTNELESRSINDILDQICKDTDLYPYVKQLASTQDGRWAFYAIHAMWLEPNHVDATASEAEAALQTSIYDNKKNAREYYTSLHLSSK